MKTRSGQIGGEAGRNGDSEKGYQNEEAEEGEGEAKESASG